MDSLKPRLGVGDRIDRVDKPGSFYIPIMRTSDGKIVARVPSDAFDGNESSASGFAFKLCFAYNKEYE